MNICGALKNKPFVSNSSAKKRAICTPEKINHSVATEIQSRRHHSFIEALQHFGSMLLLDNGAKAAARQRIVLGVNRLNGAMP